MLLQATKRSYTAPWILYCLDNFYAEYHTSSLLSSALLKDRGPAHNSTKPFVTFTLLSRPHQFLLRSWGNDLAVHYHVWSLSSSLRRSRIFLHSLFLCPRQCYPEHCSNSGSSTLVP